MDSLRKRAWVFFAAMLGSESISPAVVRALAEETAFRSAAVMGSKQCPEQAIASILWSCSRFGSAHFDVDLLTGFGDGVMSRLHILLQTSMPREGGSVLPYQMAIQDDRVSHILLWGLWYDVLALWNSAQGECWSGWWYLPESPFFLMDQSDICLQLWAQTRGEQDGLVVRMRQMLTQTRESLFPH